MFCSVGRYVEFYGPQRLLAERTFGLRPVYLPRAGYGLTVGFPRRFICDYARRAVDPGLAVVLVGARSTPSGSGRRRRWPVRLLVPAGEAARGHAGAQTAVPAS